MLQRMTITGLGPHQDFTAQFNPSGRTLIAGPSESGKTFVLEAITFCLWGRSHGGKFRTDAINDEEQKAVVEILLDSGRLIRRSMTRGSSQQRSVTIGEDTQTFTSESAFLSALGDLGSDTEALRVVIAPFEWVSMVEGNARPFRDLLARILPEADVGSEVEALMAAKGFSCEPGESTKTEKEVMALRSTARKARDEASGRLQAAEERMSGLQSTEPQAEASGAVDPEVLAAATAWADYDRVLGNTSIRLAAEQAAATWDAQQAALGVEPGWDPAFDGVEQRLQRAQLAANQATQAYQMAYGQHQTALTQMQQFQGVDPSVCPTCQRPGWEAGKQYVEQLTQYQTQYANQFQQATAQWQAASAELEQAQQASAAAREARMKRSAWEDAKKRLGKRPVVPDAPENAPPEPTMPRPDADVVAQVQASLRESAAFEGAHRQWQTNLEASKATAEREAERHAQASAQYDRLSALLEAVRAAPSTVAERQALSLGDLGPVSLEFGENPAVIVKIDGRPWWLASRGRQVVADMWLRGAIRRVLDKEWLPIVVDNVQTSSAASRCRTCPARWCCCRPLTARASVSDGATFSPRACSPGTAPPTRRGRCGPRSPRSPSCGSRARRRPGCGRSRRPPSCTARSPGRGPKPAGLAAEGPQRRRGAGLRAAPRRSRDGRLALGRPARDVRARRRRVVRHPGALRPVVDDGVRRFLGVVFQVRRRQSCPRPAGLGAARARRRRRARSRP
ncbi:MAG: AAA family ATPase [Myxococcota bacterium]